MAYPEFKELRAPKNCPYCDRVIFGRNRIYQRVVLFLHMNPNKWVTTREVADALKVSPISIIRRVLNNLTKVGLVYKARGHRYFIKLGD